MTPQLQHIDDLEPHDRELVAAAIRVRANAYAPYSQFRVGAAVRTAEGHVFLGCNVENGSFGATICAERNAVAAAIASGDRGDFKAIAITATSDEICPPCGMCRQVLAEFNPSIAIFLVSENGAVARSTLEELLPLRFRSELFTREPS